MVDKEDVFATELLEGDGKGDGAKASLVAENPEGAEKEKTRTV